MRLHHGFVARPFKTLRPDGVLAREGAVHTGRSHTWHMETIARFIPPDDKILFATPHRIVDLADPASEGMLALEGEPVDSRL